MDNNVFVAAAQGGHDALDVATLIVTALGTIAVSAYTYYAREQWKQMRGANDLTKTSLEDARINSKEALANAIESNNSTKESNDIAREVMELGNRAWVIATPIPQPSVTIQTRQAEFLIVNVGRIPATSVIVRTRALIEPGSDVPDEIRVTDPQPPAVGILAPGNIHGLRSPARFSLDEHALDALQRAEATLAIYCEITYTDWFSKPRRTVACSYYRFDQNNWAVATKHNRLD